MRREPMSRLWHSVRYRYAAWRRRHYMRSLTPAAIAPYSSGTYRKFLAHALRDGALKVASFLDAPAGPGNATLYVRHDIDTADCMRRLRVLLDVDRELGVGSAFYFRADQEEYRLADHRDEIAACRAAGFEVGLHTSCYVHDDVFAAFAEETRVFVNALGFQPQSFTVHGMGEFRVDARTRFRREVLDRLGEFGYRFTDTCPELRTYDHVFQDCHWDAARQSRFIYDDLTGRRFPFAPGQCYLLLTHPCYWTN